MAEMTLEQQRALAIASARMRASEGAASAPQPEDAATRIMRDFNERGWGKGAERAAYDLGGNVTDLLHSAGVSPETSAKFGVGARVLADAVPALFTGRFAEAPIRSLAAPVSRWLMQSAVKPQVAHLESGEAPRAITTMLEENLGPTQAGMTKGAKLARALDAKVEAQIAPSTETVNVRDVAKRLRDLLSKKVEQVNPQSDIAAINQSYGEFLNHPSIQAPQTGTEDISVQLAHRLKKGTYRSLGEKAYGEEKTISTEAQKQLARGLREEVAAAVPGVQPLLQREGNLMNVEKVAGRRAAMEANKNPMGLAALRMDDPLSAATFLADRYAALKGLLARALFRGGQPQMLTPAAMAAADALQQERK